MKPLIALLYLTVIKIRAFCESIRENCEKLQMFADFDWRIVKSDEISSGLSEDRLRLDGMLEEWEDGLNHLLRYIRSQTSADWLLSTSWLKVEELLRRTHQGAYRLEAQLCDYLHFQVGELALQESKKSIELSNRQIEEAKRGQSCS